MDSPGSSSPVCPAAAINLVFSTDAPGTNSGELAVFDADGNPIFMSKTSTVSTNQFLLDAATGNPFCTMIAKFWSAHGRWQVFRGDSIDDKDLWFSFMQTSMLQFTSEYDVFLAENTKEDECDFKVKGSFHKKACTIFEGHSTVVAAQMSEGHNVANLPLGQNDFTVSINTGMDAAFVAAIGVILHMIEQQQQGYVAENCGSGAGTVLVA